MKTPLFTTCCSILAVWMMMTFSGAGVANGASDETDYIGPPPTPFASVGSIIELPVGRTRALGAPWRVKRVSVGDPAIADVQVVGPNQVLIVGKAPGSTNLIVWSEEEVGWERRVYVQIDLQLFQDDLNLLFPDSELVIKQSQGVHILTGTLRYREEVERLNRFMVASGLKYVDMTSLAGVQQVLLKVRLAEASRNAIRTLGINMLRTGQDYFGASTIGTAGGGALNSIAISPPGGTAAGPNMPFLLTDPVGISPFVNLLVGFPRADLEFFIQALAENQYVRILAEPNLMALSGEEATFLAGGEFPIPIVQGSSAGAGSSITIEYKEFGISLKFIPTVLGEGKIRLLVAPEVSTLSDIGAVEIEGFRIPSVLTRRAETTLELNSGQTFAMAGLLSETTLARKTRVPVLGDLPVLGSFFRSVRYEQGDTELLVLVTASLVEPLSESTPRVLPGDLHNVPSDWELYGGGNIEGIGSARASGANTASVEELGFDELKGPGAWDSYDTAAERSVISTDSIAPAVEVE